MFDCEHQTCIGIINYLKTFTMKIRKYNQQRIVQFVISSIFRLCLNMQSMQLSTG